jgi:uncharacterized membrane protein
MTTNHDDDLRARAEARVLAREGFRIHLLVYILVNALLVGLWIVQGADVHSPWPLLVILFWGVGLVAHFWTVYVSTDERRNAEIEKEMDRLKRGG